MENRTAASIEIGHSQRITLAKAVSIFSLFTVYFYLLLSTLYPVLKSNLTLNPAMYWFITGFFLFIPIFACAVVMVRLEGCTDTRQIMEALNVRSLSKRDWKYAVSGLLAVFLFTGLIFGGSYLLNRFAGVRMLNTTPWFMEMQPFVGAEKLLLLVWLPMFFFNIVGEEILWRGYIQSRLPKGSWMLCSLFWLVFHLPFGADLLIMLIPVVIIIPYIFSKTQNTLVGIFIHGIFNGPIFIAVSLGLLH